MLQSDAEVLVQTLCLLVSLRLVLRLLHKALPLHDGVVQLGVGIRQLGVVHEQLEPLAEPRLASVVLGERRADGGVIAHERGVQTQGLHEVLHQLVEKSRRGERRRALDLELLALRQQEVVALARLQRHGQLEARLLLQLLDHAVARPRGREVDLHAFLYTSLRPTTPTIRSVGMVGDLVPSGDVLHDARHHLLGQLHLPITPLRSPHDVVHVRVGHVELAGGELGVVGHVDRLVAELSAQLVHAVHSSDHELLDVSGGERADLQVELRGDAHVEVEVQVVVVGDERLRRGSSGLHVHHGGLDLDEAQVVEEGADASV